MPDILVAGYLFKDTCLKILAGWQNQGYACYIVTRTYTEKVGLIDWKIGKRGKKEKKKGNGRRKNEKNRNIKEKRKKGRRGAINFEEDGQW